MTGMDTDTAAPVQVLVVDDSAETRVVVRTALQLRGGFDVVGEADCGEAAVTMARELAPDVVVLDLGLPDLTGREVLTRVQEQAPGARVVIFSGIETDDRSWLEDRADRYLLKDADIGYLVDVLGAVGREGRAGVATVGLPQDLASVRDARHFVRGRLVDWGLEDLLDVAYLVVSELAANAITHARTAYEVSLSRTEDALHIAVRDEGPGTPAPGGDDSSDLEHGRGLLLVAAMSAAWGVQRDRGEGKVVWAELRRPDDAAVAR